MPQTIKVDAVIVCIGISARYFGGINDKNIVAIRGQTVTLRAPWVKAGKAILGKAGAYVYVIPRSSGDVRLPSFYALNPIDSCDRSSWEGPEKLMIGLLCDSPSNSYTLVLTLRAC